MANGNHLTGDPEEVRKGCKFKKIKSQRPTTGQPPFFLLEIKAKVSPSEQGTKYVLHKKGIYEFFMLALRKEVSVIKGTVMG